MSITIISNILFINEYYYYISIMLLVYYIIISIIKFDIFQNNTFHMLPKY